MPPKIGGGFGKRAQLTDTIITIEKKLRSHFWQGLCTSDFVPLLGTPQTWGPGGPTTTSAQGGGGGRPLGSGRQLPPQLTVGRRPLGGGEGGGGGIGGREREGGMGGV